MNNLIGNVVHRSMCITLPDMHFFTKPSYGLESGLEVSTRASFESVSGSVAMGLDYLS